MSLRLTIFTTLLWLLCAWQYLVSSLEDNSCKSEVTCSACVQKPFCGWCFQPEDVPRCFEVDNERRLWCPPEYIYYPDNSIMVTLKKPLFVGVDRNCADKWGNKSACVSHSAEQTQLTPQIVQVKLRPRVPFSLMMTYVRADVRQPSRLELKDNSTKEVSIKYYSRCYDEEEPEIVTSKCSNTEVGVPVHFLIELELQECPKDAREHVQTIVVYPVAGNEELVVHLTMLCTCPCEQQGDYHYTEKAAECHHNGNYKCGICECDPFHYGRFCECASPNGFQEESSGCRFSNITSVDCSGRGICVCNQCECDQREDPAEQIFGVYCECDNFSCNRSDGKLCSGPDHGTCDCGKCICLPPWTGSACDCRNQTDTCYPPGKTISDVCSGHGSCDCGTCKCEEPFSGPFCDHCPTC